VLVVAQPTTTVSSTSTPTTRNGLNDRFIDFPFSFFLRFMRGKT
jgi:hypothetical protein